MPCLALHCMLRVALHSLAACNYFRACNLRLLPGLPQIQPCLCASGGAPLRRPASGGRSLRPPRQLGTLPPGEYTGVCAMMAAYGWQLQLGRLPLLLVPQAAPTGALVKQPQLLRLRFAIGPRLQAYSGSIISAGGHTGPGAAHTIESGKRHTWHCC